MNIPSSSVLESVYGESVKSQARFEALAKTFAEKYGHDTPEFFSAPGRTEIIGNHTDHNGGLVIAASIDMDTIGVASPNNSSMIHITSEGYAQEICVDLDHLEATPKEQGSPSLVAGMAEAIRKFGYQISGFDACLSTTVIPAAGVSSSASFQMLICSVVNYFFNGGSMSYIDYAKIGQYAENVYWNKASGLMDQLACAVGGPILMNFADQNNPTYQKSSFGFQDNGYQLVIVNTGKGHADLSQEYSSVPLEMKEIASALRVQRLCETTREKFLEFYSDPKNAAKITNDRCILRAMHFWNENDRVKKASEAIQCGDTRKLLTLMKQSGDSSWEFLQNCYSLANCQEQKITLALALSQNFLDQIGDGICRVHGGGFAGVIMCIVPVAQKDNYVEFISRFVGKENVYPMNIRKTGAVHLELGKSLFTIE